MPILNRRVPRGLMARILGFYPKGPGSIPGVGEHFFFTLFLLHFFLFISCLSCLTFLGLLTELCNIIFELQSVYWLQIIYSMHWNHYHTVYYYRNMSNNSRHTSSNKPTTVQNSDRNFKDFRNHWMYIFATKVFQ